MRGPSTLGSGVAALLLALSLSACLGGPRDPATRPAEPAAPLATADALTCGLEGVVVDDDFLPLAGANVTLFDLARSVTTDAAGRFVLSLVPPGPHDLRAGLAGYASQDRRVECRAGVVTRGILVALAATGAAGRPFAATFPTKVRIGCALGFTSSTEDACRPRYLHPSNPGLDPDANATLFFTPPAGADRVTGAVYEARWQRTSALGAEWLQLSFHVPYGAPRPGSLRGLCEGTLDRSSGGAQLIVGRSPMCVRIEPAGPEGAAYLPATGGWKPFRLDVWPRGDFNLTAFIASPTTYRDETSHLVVAQNVEVWATQFYNGAPPPLGFSAADG